MSNRFAALAEAQPPSQEKPKASEPKGRDSKRHEPHEPVHGRQFDRNSVKGEKRFPPKEGGGRGGWGNQKDDFRKPREETEDQKKRREEREKEAAETKQKHEEYLKTIQKLEAPEVVVESAVTVTKNVKVDGDLASFAKKKDTETKKAQKVKTIVNL